MMKVTEEVEGSGVKVINEITGRIDESTNSISRFIYPSSIRNKAARAICMSAVAVEPLYSTFIWQSSVDATLNVMNMFGMDHSTIANYVEYIVIPFAIANLISDMTSVDPLREADEFTNPYRNTKNKQLSYKKLILGSFLKFIALSTSYSVGGSADAIPIGDLSREYIPDLTGNILRYGGLAFVTSLGIVYYMMFLNPRIQRHVNEFVSTINNPVEFFSNFLRNPATYIEIWTQCISNAFYRSVTYSYVLGEVGEELFYINKTRSLSHGFSATTGATTFLTTLFTRFLSTHDKFINPRFKDITKKDLAEVPKFSRSLIYDALLSLIRGGALGFILSKFIPLIPALNYGISASVGSLVASHSLYVRYRAKRYQEALRLKLATDTESQLPLVNPNSLNSVNITELMGESFDEIAASYDSQKMHFTINVINFMSRLTRFIAFFLFVDIFNQIFLDDSLDNLSVIALAFLWGAEVFKNDGDIYKESMLTTWQGFAVKCKLEKENNDNASYFSGRFFRPVRAAFKSVYDYSPSLIIDTANKLGS